MGESGDQAGLLVFEEEFVGEWVQLEEYNPGWKQEYEQERKRLRGILKSCVKDIQHVGSTAIPGLCARPEIDILLLVKPGAAPEAERILTADSGCRKLDPEKGTSSEHPREAGSPEGDTLAEFLGGETAACRLLLAEAGDSPAAERILALRDYLMTHPDVMRVYRDLKWELAGAYPAEAEQYEAGKEAFLEGLLPDARAWGQATGKLSSHMSLGMVLGVIPGGILGALLGNMPLGAVMGLMLGMVLGVFTDNRRKGETTK